MTVRSASSARAVADALLPSPSRPAALSQTPASFAERVYARGVYPAIQARAHRRVERGAVRALRCRLRRAGGCRRRDLVARASRRAGRRRSWQPVGRALWRARCSSPAVAVVWFQLAWGLNYARPPVDVRLALPPGAPSAGRGRRAARRAPSPAPTPITRAAHADGFPGQHDVPAALVGALHAVERVDGRTAAHDAWPPEGDAARRRTSAWPASTA